LKTTLGMEVEVPRWDDLLTFQRGSTVIDPDFPGMFEMGKWIHIHEPDMTLMPSNGGLMKTLRILKG